MTTESERIKELEDVLRIARAALVTADGYYMPTPKVIEVTNAISAINRAMDVEHCLNGMMR